MTAPGEAAGDMPLTGHLAELRKRILYSLAAVLAGTVICLFFIQKLISLLTAPAGHLYFARPAEVFVIYMKTASYCRFYPGVAGGFLPVLAFYPAGYDRQGKDLDHPLRPPLGGTFPWGHWIFLFPCHAPKPSFPHGLRRREFHASSFHGKLSGVCAAHDSSLRRHVQPAPPYDGSCPGRAGEGEDTQKRKKVCHSGRLHPGGGDYSYAGYSYPVPPGAACCFSL